MIWLIDTNILARAAQPHHPHFDAAVEAVSVLGQRGDTLRVAPQNLYEFWALGTRPIENNGLGLSIEEAHQELSRIAALYAPLCETPAVYAEWFRLVSNLGIRGRTGHDARLVAIMNVHGIKRILTFNMTDFSRYPGIVVQTPHEVLQHHP